MEASTTSTTTTNRAEAERLLGVSEKLLHNLDLRGSRDFAILAQETEPLLEGSDQILAVTDVLLAAGNRINNNHHDWYSILQIDRKSDDLEVVKRQYRRLALLLHPDKNKFAHADSAFKLVADAWSVLSDSSKKSVYDNELNYFFSKVDLVASRNTRAQGPIHRQTQNRQQQNMQPQQTKLPVKRGVKDNKQKETTFDDSGKMSSFWTACPYCYILYEYPKAYDDCCLRCQKCQRAFHAAPIPSLPPLVPGKEAYYCCWGFFPLGFSTATNSDGGDGGAWNAAPGFPNRNAPPVFEGEAAANDSDDVNVEFSVEDGDVTVGFDVESVKKRGRPRKYTRQG